MDIENGWVIDEKHKPQKIGCCDYCGRRVYDDEEYEYNGDTLLCFDCSMLLNDELDEQIEDYLDEDE